MIARSFTFHVKPGQEQALVDAYRQMMPNCRACNGFVDMKLFSCDEDGKLWQGISYWESKDALNSYSKGEKGQANLALMEGLLSDGALIYHWGVFDLE